MPRAQKGAARRQSKNRWFDKTKGKHGARNNQWKKTKETVYRAGAYAYRDRRLVKRDYRQLWITRISAALGQRAETMSYSRFMNGLKLANIFLNRKMLSEVAIHDPAAFDALIAQARQAHMDTYGTEPGKSPKMVAA